MKAKSRSSPRVTSNGTSGAKERSYKASKTSPAFSKRSTDPKRKACFYSIEDLARRKTSTCFAFLRRRPSSKTSWLRTIKSPVWARILVPKSPTKTGWSVSSGARSLCDVVRRRSLQQQRSAGLLTRCLWRAQSKKKKRKGMNKTERVLVGSGGQSKTKFDHFDDFYNSHLTVAASKWQPQGPFASGASRRTGSFS